MNKSIENIRTKSLIKFLPALFLYTFAFFSSFVHSEPDEEIKNASQCDSCSFQIDSLDTPFSLVGSWLFTRDDKPTNSELNIDTSDWVLAHAPGPWAKIYNDKKNFRVGWYRGEFNFDQKLIGQKASFLIDAYVSSFSVYIDGKKIYERDGSDSYKKYYAVQPIPILFEIDKTNMQVAIRVDSLLMIGIYQLPFQIRSYNKRDPFLIFLNLWANDFRIISTHVTLFFGLFFIMLYFKTKDTFYLTVGMLGVAFYPYGAFGLETYVDLFNPETLLILSYLGIGLININMSFITQFFHDPMPRLNKVFSVTMFFILLFLIYLAFDFDLDQFQLARKLLFLLSTIIGISIVIHAIRSIRAVEGQKKRDLSIIVFGIFVYTALVYHDMFMALGMYNSFFVAFAGMLILISCVIWVASNMFARTFVKNKVMVNELKGLNENLEEIVDEKTRDIKSILEAIQQGILAIEDEHGSVGPEHSKYLKEIVGTDNIAGNSFYELLFKHSMFTQDEKSQMMSVISASVGQDEMGFDMNGHLLPREAIVQTSGNEPQVFELDWNPILKENIVTKILLVVRDVTELRALELASEKQRQEIEIIQEIINVPTDKFDSMIISCYRFIDENIKIIREKSSFELDSIQDLFRNMHTMKGLARSYNLKSLSEASHIAEQFYSRSIESKAWDPSIMLEELNKTKEIIDNYKQVNEEKLGRSAKGIDDFTIDRRTIEDNLNLLSNFDISELSIDGKVRIESVKHLFKRLIRYPIEQVLRDQVKATASLARQLGKSEPLVVFNDPGFSINREAHDLMNNIFIHLFRNAIDHGIEQPEERIKKGKPEQAKLSFVLADKNSQLVIRFSDDGRGLNLPAIYDSAIKNGVIKESDNVNPEFVANLIFASGFSTAKEVTDISGRGVGMDAVKKFLEKENCSIEIRVLDSSKTELTLSPVEFIITLPTNLFQYLGEREI